MKLLRFVSFAVLAMVTAAGCDGPGVVGPGRRIARVTTDDPGSQLVGTWRRAVFFFDDFGISHSNETTFRFDAGGAVTRVQIDRNLTEGFASTLTSAGTWSLEGSTVLIDFVTPSSFRLQLSWRVVGDTLELAGQSYLRVTD